MHAWSSTIKNNSRTLMSEHCPRIKLILGKFHSDEEDREEEKKKTGNSIQPCCINGLVNLRIYYNQMNKRDFSCMTRTYLRQARQADLASLGRKPEHRICFRLDYQPLFGKMSPHIKTGPGRRWKSSLDLLYLAFSQTCSSTMTLQ